MRHERFRLADPRLLILVAFLALGFVAVEAAAQTNPFGGPRSPASPPAEGLVGYIMAKQAEFYRAISANVRAAKADGNAVWSLFLLSFLYGIFHAAGPGHGKAVISSYLVANEETWRRGVTLSFASAMLQAAVAVAIVSVAGALLGVTARTMGGAVRWIEIVSYLLIAAIGARLLWVKGRGFLRALSAARAEAASHAPAHAHAHQHDHNHHHGHDQDDHAGHSHGPEPQDLAGAGGWRRGLAAIVAVGLRPCSGAILVLVFALAQGLYWAGVASTFIMGLGTALTVTAIATLAVGAKGVAARIAKSRGGYGAVLLRGVETVAAALVLAFGGLLLLGYMASERMFAV